MRGSGNDFKSFKLMINNFSVNLCQNFRKPSFLLIIGNLGKCELSFFFEVYLIYNVSVIQQSDSVTVQQSDLDIHMYFFFKLFSIISYYKILNIVPCSIQQVFVVCLFLNDLPLEKPICKSGSNSQNWTWNNRLVSNRKRSTSRLYIVTLLI